jgi:phytoene synthase
LQLANIWQDEAVDLGKNRIYQPQDECERFGVDGEDLATQTRSEGFKKALAFQVERTRRIFTEGKPLGLALSGRLGVEIRLTWLTGMTILKKIEHADFDVFHRRPKLTRRDFARMLATALSQKRYVRFER